MVLNVGLNARKYDAMVTMLMNETYKKGIPFNEESHEKIELTCEAMAQGIKGKEALTLFVDAGYAEKRYENRYFLIHPNELVDNSDDIINGSE